MLPSISIISSSVRTGRNSHRVALYFQKQLQKNYGIEAPILDLQAFNFPLFDERLKFQKSPSPQALLFAEKIKASDGIIIVTPEYNGGYPAALKNVTDLLYDEWHRKPVAISTVSEGPFGGSQVITSLQFSLWKMKAWTVPAMFPVSNIEQAFDAEGAPADAAKTDARAKKFIDELLWCVEARNKMQEKKL